MDQLRDGVKEWTLAADSGLLNTLREISEKIVYESKQLSDVVEDLLYDTQATEVKLNNTFNSFLNLAHFQYVENRVYDETPVAKTEPEPQQAPGESAEGNIDNIIIPKYTEAISYAMKALEKSIITQDDDEDKEITDADRKKYNVWFKRPLPCLFFGEEYRSETVGLYVEESEEEEAEINYVPGVPTSSSTTALPENGESPVTITQVSPAPPANNVPAPPPVSGLSNIPVPPPVIITKVIEPTNDDDDLFKIEPDEPPERKSESSSGREKKRKKKRKNPKRRKPTIRNQGMMILKKAERRKNPKIKNLLLSNSMTTMKDPKISLEKRNPLKMNLKRAFPNPAQKAKKNPKNQKKKKIKAPNIKVPKMMTYLAHLSLLQ